MISEKNVFFAECIKNISNLLQKIYYYTVMSQIKIVCGAFVMFSKLFNVKDILVACKLHVSDTLYYIWKVGKLIPCKKSKSDNLLATSKFIDIDSVTK